MSSLFYSQLAVLLDKLTAAMKHSQIYDIHEPAQAAYLSQAPFACDTMTFEQWLRFVFLPRMRLIVDNRQPLPASCNIAPMAQQGLAPLRGRAQLITLLTELDKKITREAP